MWAVTFLPTSKNLNYHRSHSVSFVGSDSQLPCHPLMLGLLCGENSLDHLTGKDLHNHQVQPDNQDILVVMIIKWCVDVCNSNNQESRRDRCSPKRTMSDLYHTPLKESAFYSYVSYSPVRSWGRIRCYNIPATWHKWQERDGHTGGHPTEGHPTEGHQEDKGTVRRAWESCLGSVQPGEGEVQGGSQQCL